MLLLLVLLLLLRWCHFNLNGWWWCCWLLGLRLNYHHLLLLLRLLSQHGRHLGHQLERRSRLNGVQAHVGAGQVLHLLLLDWSCNKRMACRSVQHRCTVHVHYWSQLLVLYWLECWMVNLENPWYGSNLGDRGWTDGRHHLLLSGEWWREN